MRYVLDSCVAVKWFLAEPDSAKALQLLDDFNGEIHKLFAPDVFPVEIDHALSRERRGLLEEPAAMPGEPALLAEPAIAADWSRPEEDAAWSHLQPAK